MAGPDSLPLAPLLVGEPGVGKNRMVYELADRTGRDLYIFQGHEDVTAEDLACSVRFSDDPSTKMDYVISPLVTAMRRGGICFIDEIGKIRPRALALLVSVLDERRYVDSSLLGERVFAHENFRFIAATNTGEINALPEFVRSRMRPIIKVGYPPKEQVDRIVASQFPHLEERLRELLDTFWSLWDQNGPPPSPRDAIQLFALASSLGDFERLGGESTLRESRRHQPFPLGGRNGRRELDPHHLRLAFHELFRREEPRSP
jgi:MoxR-like ATPase